MPVRLLLIRRRGRDSAGSGQGDTAERMALPAPGCLLLPLQAGKGRARRRLRNPRGVDWRGREHPCHCLSTERLPSGASAPSIRFSTLETSTCLLSRHLQAKPGVQRAPKACGCTAFFPQNAEGRMRFQRTEICGCWAGHTTESNVPAGATAKNAQGFQGPGSGWAYRPAMGNLVFACSRDFCWLLPAPEET